MIYARKTDANQREVVEALRRIGCSVALTYALGKGFPDAVAGWVGLSGRPFTVLLEIKSTAAAKLTPDEKKFHENWIGALEVVRDPQEAVLTMQRYREVN